MGPRFCPSVSISEVPGFPEGNPHFHPAACSVLQPELLTEGRGLDLPGSSERIHISGEARR